MRLSTMPSVIESCFAIFGRPRPSESHLTTSASLPQEPAASSIASLLANLPPRVVRLNWALDSQGERRFFALFEPARRSASKTVAHTKAESALVRGLGPARRHKA